MDTIVTVDSGETEPEGMDMETACTDMVVMVDTEDMEDMEDMEVTEVMEGES